MTSTLTPYIHFEAKAREALEFYASVLGGTPDIMTFGSQDPDAGADYADHVMHGFLRTGDGFELMASDAPPGEDVTRGGQMSLSLSGDDDALRGYFEQLAEGGTVHVPLEKQMWGDEFGMFEDKFGIAWLVNLGPGEHAAQEPNQTS